MLTISVEERCTSVTLGAAGMKILRDVVAGIAGADDERALALEILAVVIAGGMHDLAGKVLQASNVGNVGDAGRRRSPAPHGADA